MPETVPLPASVAEIVTRNRRKTHPGLLLDKYAQSWDPDAAGTGKLSERVQKPTVEGVVDASQHAPDGLSLEELNTRRRKTLQALDASFLTAKTTGPLTLHLARASALENAGICLHPIYGFVYLPGTGVKGMARAYAETIWLPAQPEPSAAKARIIAVFGNETPSKAKGTVEFRAGSVVFHDAWPAAWPRLAVDIVNNHHSEYYKGNDAPGDWEDPIPVYFLAVQPGVTFDFALSRRTPTLPAAHLQLAAEWLAGALAHLGAGAKTAAGYGAFEIFDAPVPALPASSDRICEASYTLELVTPAFLAGAAQQKEDCDLRPATLRGLLRWWWRTMHAGFVDWETLRRLEAAIWGGVKHRNGDVETAGAVRVTVTPEEASPRDAEQFSFKKPGKKRYQPRDEIASEFGLARPPKKTTQGLFYLSYGMDDDKEKSGRHFLSPGAAWKVRLVTKQARYAGRTISVEHVQGQAENALRLLCQYGGVGSKARKGFGSFADLDDFDLDAIRASARRLREAAGVSNDFDERKAQSPALEMLLHDELSFKASNPWQALDAVGFAVQRFAQENQHQERKRALGLPRKIHGPRPDGPINKGVQDPKRWEPPLWLGRGHGESEVQVGGRSVLMNVRDAAPVHYHVARGASGKYQLRIAAFPHPRLPDLAESRRVLNELVAYLRANPPHVRADDRRQGREARRAPGPRVAPARATAGLSSGQWVRVRLTEKREKKGKSTWFACHEPTDLTGPVQQSERLPADAKPGDELDLVVAIPSQQSFALRAPHAKDLAECDKPKGGGKGPKGKGRARKGRRR